MTANVPPSGGSANVVSSIGPGIPIQGSAMANGGMPLIATGIAALTTMAPSNVVQLSAVFDSFARSGKGPMPPQSGKLAGG